MMRIPFILPMLLIVFGCQSESHANRRSTTADEPVPRFQNAHTNADALVSASPIPAAAPMATATPEAEAPAGPNPDEIYIVSVAHLGTGCPEGSVAQNISPDSKAFTLLFDAFAVELAGGVEPAASSLDCDVQVKLHLPEGWTVAVATVDYRGYASLSETATGEHSFTYGFADAPSSSTLVTTVPGPYDADIFVRQEPRLESLVFAPCGETATLNLGTKVSIKGQDADANGLFAIDSLDGEFRHVLGLHWQECPTPPSDPTNVVANAVSSTEIAITWQSPGADIVDYVVTYGQAGEAPPACVLGATTVATNLTINGLIPDTAYAIRVCSRDAQGDTSHGIIVTARTPPRSTCAAQLTNVTNPLDVDGDGDVSPLDALIVINFLNSTGSGAVTADQVGPPFLDVSGNCSISPLDVLLVINHLNGR